VAHKFDPAHLDRLLDPKRQEADNPEVVLDALDLKPGDILVDVGSGPGWFSLPAAARVGAAGRVYALDIEAQMLAVLKERAREASLDNIESYLIEEGSPWPLADGACNKALIANVLHEVDQKASFTRELRRVLRQGGRGLVVDWSPTAPGDVGPPSRERLSRETAARVLEEAGFTVVERLDIGPYHYGVLFEKTN